MHLTENSSEAATPVKLAPGLRPAEGLTRLRTSREGLAKRGRHSSLENAGFKVRGAV